MHLTLPDELLLGARSTRHNIPLAILRSHDRSCLSMNWQVRHGNRKAEGIIIVGVNRAKRLAASLVRSSIWFSVEPLAEGPYVFTVKADDLDRVVT